MDDALFVGGFKGLRDLPAMGNASAMGIGPRAMCAERSSPSTNSITRAREAPTSFVIATRSAEDAEEAISSIP